MNIIEDINMVEFFRKPHSKKRRILKKWKKRGENTRPRTDSMIIEGHTIICHPSLAVKIRAIDKEYHDALNKTQDLATLTLMKN